ncbi:MAG: MFS transporter [Bacteroidaceae bacterium]|nr:MFS transporter [Bacteroidaceae bacterium]
MIHQRETLTSKHFIVPFTLVTSLFFLWGFARAILDVLNQHFRESLNISIAESALIQVTTYMGYFLMAIPAGLFINRFGYKRGVVFGLVLYALGAFLFLPCGRMGTLGAFLVCLFVIACGLALLETSANPYAAQLGAKETAASRLNFAQSFNGLGSCLAPVIVGSFLFANGQSADISIPYVIMGVVVVIVAIVFSFSRLPEIRSEESAEAETALKAETAVRSPYAKLLRNKMFVFGACALLAYEVAEISINSYFVLFTTGVEMLTAGNASIILGFALMFFMAGRFVGSWVMQYMTAEKALYICTTGSLFSIVGVIVSAYAVQGADSWLKYLPLCFLLLNYVCEAIMFPTIFSLAIKGLGGLTKSASSVLMMAPVGGCVFLLVGYVADVAGYIVPFVIPLLAFAVVWCYARTQYKESIAD